MGLGVGWVGLGVDGWVRVRVARRAAPVSSEARRCGTVYPSIKPFTFALRGPVAYVGPVLFFSFGRTSSQRTLASKTNLEETICGAGSIWGAR